MFRSKLLRRPNSSEDIDSVAGHMQSLINEGVPPQLILDTMVKRGRSAEAVWDFRKRVLTAFKETTPAPSHYDKVAAKTDEELRRRGAIK
jgi:hypothetical protein